MFDPTRIFDLKTRLWLNRCLWYISTAINSE